MRLEKRGELFRHRFVGDPLALLGFCDLDERRFGRLGRAQRKQLNAVCTRQHSQEILTPFVL